MHAVPEAFLSMALRITYGDGAREDVAPSPHTTALNFRKWLHCSVRISQISCGFPSFTQPSLSLLAEDGDE